MAEPATDLTLDSPALLASEEHEVAIRGRSPWYLAWRRLRRNYVALFSLFVALYKPWEEWSAFSWFVGVVIAAIGPAKWKTASRC